MKISNKDKIKQNQIKMKTNIWLKNNLEKIFIAISFILTIVFFILKTSEEKKEGVLALTDFIDFIKIFFLLIFVILILFVMTIKIESFIQLKIDDNFSRKIKDEKWIFAVETIEESYGKYKEEPLIKYMLQVVDCNTNQNIDRELWGSLLNNIAYKRFDNKESVELQIKESMHNLLSPPNYSKKVLKVEPIK